MNILKRSKRKIFAGIMSVIMVLSILPITSLTATAAEIPPDQITVQQREVFGVWFTGESGPKEGTGFIMSDGSVGICASHNIPAPAAGAGYTIDRSLGNTYQDGDLASPSSTDWTFRAFYYAEKLEREGTNFGSTLQRTFVVEMVARRQYYDQYTWHDVDPYAKQIHDLYDALVAAAEADANGVSARLQYVDGVVMYEGTDGTGARLAYYRPDSGGNIQNLMIYTSGIPMSGYANLVKTSANGDISNGNGNYSLAGAVYGIYTDWDCTNEVGRFTTDEWGNSNTVQLNAGTYYVKEITAPMGYALDPNTYEVTVTSGQTATVYVTDVPQSDPIAMLLQKQDADTGLAAPQGDTSLANAEFTVKYFSGYYDTNPEDLGIQPTRQWVLKTDKNGISLLDQAFKVSGDEFYYTSFGTPTLPLGTVTIQETKAPEGYLPNSEVFIRQVTSKGIYEGVQTYNAPTIREQAIRGGVQVRKADAENGTEQGNGTLAGAQIEIINESANAVVVNGTTYQPGEVVLTLTTGEDGTAATAADVLPYGHYRYKESVPPEGYELNDTFEGTFDIVENGVIVDLTSEENTIHDSVIRGGVKLQKRDLETGLDTPQGGASLSGAVFNITNISSFPVLVEGTLYQPNEVVKTVTTGEDGSVTTAADLLPYGSYRVDEITAPDGYLPEGTLSRTFDIVENGVIVDLTGESTSILNQIKRGDLELIKIEDGTNHRMQYIPFQITSKTTGESHVIVTDENGYASTHSSWNSHLNNTNAGQSPTDGIWFGTSQPDDTKGALPYDTYIIDELPCANNEGKQLLTGIEITISRDNYTVDLGTLTNDDIPQEGIVQTTAKDQATGTNKGEAAPQVTIVDTVQYENLKVGVEYTLQGILMDKETNSPLLVNGQQVTAQTVFTPTQTNGTVDVVFTFDGSALAGKEVVVFETLYRNGIEIASHADINDVGQTVTYYGEDEQIIGTTAKDGQTGTNEGAAAEQVTIIDTVQYANLKVGTEYTVRGILMDKSTDQPLLVNGQQVTAETTFTAETAAGTVDVVFTFDGSALAGKTVVVFESLYRDGIEIAVHADINDEGQTVRYPEIGTTAKDSQTVTNEGIAADQVTIVDTVQYTNLTVGNTYTVKGILMDKSTGEPLLVNGQQVTAETTFTAETAAGTVDVVFTFDGSALAGKEIVVFETLYRDGIEIAVHTDINDEAQTVTYSAQPEVPVTPEVPKTGDNQWLIPMLTSSLLVSAVLLAGVILHKKNRAKNSNS